MPGSDPFDFEKLELLILEAKASGGSELANYQLFVIGLCNALGLKPPDMAKDDTALNDYVVRAPYDLQTCRWLNHRADASIATSAIASSLKPSNRQSATQTAGSKPVATCCPKPASAARSSIAHEGAGTRSCLAARKQAEDYARALPVDHGYPPFLLIVDVGHVIEVYADFSGQGKNYAHFPDRQSYRITMDDLLGGRRAASVSPPSGQNRKASTPTAIGGGDARHRRAAGEDRRQP